LGLFSCSLLSAPPNSDEAQLKVALLYKISQFVTWPNSNLTEFGVCLLGRSALREPLKALETQKIAGQRLNIHYLKQSDSIKQQCQIVFISQDKQAFLSTILTSLSNRPILTLSDMPDFAKNGGMIQLSKKDNRIHFIIHLSKVKSAKLNIAAPLLQLSTITSQEDKK